MDLFSFSQGDRHAEMAADLAEAKKAEATARSLQSELIDVQRRTDRLALACAALLEILQERLGITDEEMEERMRAVDLRDGSEDGRITEQPTACRKCRRTTHPKRPHCIYCGTPVKRKPMA